MMYTLKTEAHESQKVFHGNKTVTMEVSGGCGRAARAQCETKSQRRCRNDAAANDNGTEGPNQSLGHLSPTIKAAQNQYMHEHRERGKRKKSHLPDLGDFGASLADDAADELVGHGHLVGLGLRACRRPVVAGAQLTACQGGQRCVTKHRH